jgi:hypothetical protein
MAEELDTYPPAMRKDISEQIRLLCYELMRDYSRLTALNNGESVEFSFHS